MEKQRYNLNCSYTGLIEILTIARFANTITSELVLSRERQLMNLLRLNLKSTIIYAMILVIS